MANLTQRLDRLESELNVNPGVDLMACWLAAHKQGLFCDMETGKPITFSQLQKIDPIRAARLQGIKEIRDLTNP